MGQMDIDRSDNTKQNTIYETLQKEICNGKYDLSHPFPSEMQLVKRFKVSRFTAVQALKALEKAHLIVRHKGRRSFPTKFAKSSVGPIGLIMPGLAYGEIYAPICGEITRLCQRHGRTVLLGNTTVEIPIERAKAAKQLAKDFVAQHVAGVIMHPIEFLRDSADANREIIAIFEKASVPVVLIDYDIVPCPQRSSYDLVGIDNFAAGRCLGEHLISEGARNILFIKRKNCASTVENRLAGISVAMMSAGLKWTSKNVMIAEPNASGAVVRRLKESNPRPDAVVCGYDVHAARVLKAVEKNLKSISIPQDIKLAGFDDVRCASVMSPALTTIHQPCKEIAREAMALLFRRLANPDVPACTMLLDAPLVVRESTRRVKK